jgi:hypothetical protein
MLQGLATPFCTSRLAHVPGTRAARWIAAVLAIALLARSPATPRVGAQNDPPAEAIQRYLDAVFLGAGDPGPLVCQSDRDANAGPGAIVSAADALGISADTSGLTYETTQQAETWARVDVTGRVVFAIEGLDAPLEVPIRALGLGTFWPVFERGAWRACSTPPAEAQGALGPDVIARQFMTAAYAGDYDAARALLCDAQRSRLSRAQYDAAFGSLRQQGVSLDLDTALFEIVEQDGAEAIVAIGGQIALSWTEQGRSIVLDAAQLGFGPVRLIDENGWKVCSEPG